MHLESSISGHVYRRQGPRADVWYAKWRGADGRQHKRRLGPAWSGRGRPAAGYLTKRLAEGELRRILDDEDQGVGIAAPAREITIAEAAVEWLRYAEFDRSCKPSTLVDYRSTLTRYVLPYLADVHLSDLTPQAVERWRARLTHGPKRPLSNRTRNKALTVLHGVLERARVVYGLVTNPAADVEKLREQLDPTRFPAYTPEEVHALVRAAAEEQDGVIYLTAAFTGLRRGELLALRWRHVDFDLEAVRVVESYAHRQTTSPKSGHGRVVPMVPAVAEALARLSMRPQLTAPDDLVFIGRLGGHVDGAALRRRFHAARERVGLRYVRFHDLRHSFGTLGARGAESLVELQAWMGHADIKTTMRYAHYRHQRDAARRLGGILVGPDEAVPSQVDAPTDSLGSDSEPESQKSPANSRAPWSGSRPRLD